MVAGIGLSFPLCSTMNQSLEGLDFSWFPYVLGCMAACQFFLFAHSCTYMGLFCSGKTLREAEVSKEKISPHLKNNPCRMFLHFWYFMICKPREPSHLRMKFKVGEPYKHDELPEDIQLKLKEAEEGVDIKIN